MAKRIKITYEDTNRIIEGPSDYTELTSKILKLFPDIDLNHFRTYYLDNDGDLILATCQKDYEIALDSSEKEIHFYIGKSSDDVQQSTVYKSNIKRLAQKSSESIIPSKPSVFVCIGCKGTKMNQKRTKPCRICKGTGAMPKEYIDEVVNITKSSMAYPELMETQMVERAPMELDSEPIAKSVVVNTVFKIGTQKSTKTILRSSITSESISDGYEVEPEQVFEKVWVMVNSGADPWPIDTVFCKVDGDDIKTDIFKVGCIEPTKSIKVPIKMKAPKKPGRYVAYFRLCHGENERFGQKPWIDFIVKEKESNQIMNI